MPTFGEGAALTILDVSNPAQPVRVSRLFLPDFVTDVQLVGNLVYVANWDEGLRIIDVSDVSNPGRPHRSWLV